MFGNLEEDRKYIENKYHKTDEPFNPYTRMAYHGYAYDKTTGLCDGQIKEGLVLLSEENRDLPHPIAKAKAISYVLANTRIDVSEHDWFVGIYSWNRLIKHTTVHKWKEEVFCDILPETKQKMKDFNDSGAIAIWPDFDHVVPDWQAILHLGFSGIKKRAETYREWHIKNGTMTEDMASFFAGIDIEYSAILAVIDRMYQYALTKKHKKAQKIAACLKNIRDGAPANIYEAMQVMYLYFMISESVDYFQVRSLGNGLDSALYPFYKHDMETGTFTKAEMKEYLAYFLLQWSAIGNYWGQPFYMGGTNEDGSTKMNGLSYEIIDVYDKLNLYNPKIQIKVNGNIPEKFLRKVLDMVRNGKNSFVFCCEPGMIKAVMGYGATYSEALSMDIRGCYETGVRANEVSSTTGYVNALKAVEYVFSNGYDKGIQKTIGLKTGNTEDFNTFDGFYFAVLRQWKHLIENTISMANAYEPYLGVINPSSLYSATVEGCLKRGCDAYAGGVKFSTSSILNCGFASLVDAVMAVKTFVFDQREIAMADLKRALDANWQGYECLRQKIKNAPCKYGCGHDETDLFAESMARFFALSVNHRPNARGGFYKASMHSAMEFVWQGEKTFATPDGRKEKEEMSKNASPAPGMDKNGVTALINTVAKLKPDLYQESFCVDVMLHPSAVAGDEGLDIMQALIFTYLKSGGMAIQFNVLNAKTLLEAQKNPEKFKNLQVRVCGWNVLWNHLSKKEQDAYIERANNIGEG